MNTQLLTLETMLTVDAASRLCGCSTKTLDRDRNAGKITYTVDEGRNMVTVGELVKAGRYELGAESAEDRSRCAQLEAETKAMREQLVTTEMELYVVQAQCRSMEKALDAKDSEINAVRGQIAQLERLVSFLEGFAPKSIRAEVK